METLKSLIEHDLIDFSPETTVNPFTTQKIKSFSAYKLPELRDIAESLSIELTKLLGEREKRKQNANFMMKLKQCMIFEISTLMLKLFEITVMKFD